VLAGASQARRYNWNIPVQSAGCGYFSIQSTGLQWHSLWLIINHFRNTLIQKAESFIRRQVRGSRMSGNTPRKDAFPGTGTQISDETGLAMDVLSGIGRIGTSRRAFIKSIIATGASVSAGFMLAGCSRDEESQGSNKATPAATAPASGGVERLVTLNVNGRERRVDVLPNETLAMTIRYKLGLTGTKLGCDRGECGACTVLIDDVAHYSCSTLTHTVRGRNITTIEGLVAENGDLHPVQQAFVQELGPQCGFCTPGQVMSAVALLKVNPNPTREEARHALSGNLCRCGAYDNYLNSVMAAAKMS